MTSTGDEPLELLLVEDNPGDVTLIEEALEDSSVDTALRVVSDGREALDYLHQRGDYEAAPIPDLLFLDLSLPAASGFEVLDALEDPPLDRIPVMIVTGSASSDDVARGYELGANAYFVKPADPEEYIELVRSAVKLWAEFAELPET